MKSILNIPFITRPSRTLLLDLHLPEGPIDEPLPLIVWFVGGGWIDCNKAHCPIAPTQYGYAVASVEYRISSEAIAPANIYDCKASIRWLRAHASEYHLDPGRISVWGSSAGGLLATILGLTSGLPDFSEDPDAADASSEVRSWMNFCGPSDLSQRSRPEFRARFKGLYDVASKYLGGPVEENLELARLVSPMTYVRKDCPPGFIVHGKLDNVVPMEENIELQAALSALGADTSLLILDQGGHGWPEEMSSAAVRSFWDRTLKPKQL